MQMRIAKFILNLGSIGFILLLLSPIKAQQFTNISQSAGVTDVHEAEPLEGTCVFDVTFLMNSGCAFGDYNNDGYMDLYLGDGGNHPNVLYKNNGDGTFTDVTQNAGVGDLSRSMGVGFGDINNDGWPEIYVANFGQPNKLYLNNRDGTFTDISTQAGVAHTGFNTSLVFDDFNKDGWLDIYVITYGEICDNVPEDDSLAGGQNVLYINNQDGSTFTDMTIAADASGGTRWSLAVTSVDIDNDGDQDIYIADDFKAGSTLLINEFADQGMLKFTDKSDEYGVRLLGNMMCSTFGDIDNDGDFDFYSTNIRDGFPEDLQRFNGNALFRNDYPTSTFTDISEESATTGEIELNGQTAGDHWGWGAVFLDVDFDGLPDIFEVNGWPVQPYAFIPNLIFKNQDGTSFVEMGQSLGAARPLPGDPFLLLDSRGVAKADIDNDGDEDIYIRNNRDSGVLFRNDYAGSNHWLQVEALGTVSNRMAIGTKVRVTADGMTRTDYITGGNSYLSQSSPILTFGLGQATTVDSLVVLWPAGGREVFFNLQADVRYRVIEGQGIVTRVSPTDNTPVSGASDTSVEVHSIPEGIRISYTGSPGSFLQISIFNLLGQKVAGLFEGTVSSSQQEFIWNGTNKYGGQVGSGVYFVRVFGESYVSTKKVVLVR